MIDLEKAEKALRVTAELLENLGIKYWIDSGTLLGIYRDNSLIPYDHDIDIRCLPQQVTDDNIASLVIGLWNIGYHVVIENKGKRAQLICVNTEGIMLDLKFAFQDDSLLWIYCWRSASGVEKPRVHCYPRKFFRHMTDIEFKGRKYPAPAPIEDYIKAHYGEDWRKFKASVEQAEDTDLSWDYMFNPPSAMSLEELEECRQPDKGAPKATENNKKEG